MKDLSSIFDNYRNDVADFISKVREIAYQQGKEEKCDKCKYFISVAEAYKQSRAEAIDDVERELLRNGFIATHHALEVWHEITEQLKENK